jgi:hypothetical protein
VRLARNAINVNMVYARMAGSLHVYICNDYVMIM